MEGKMSVSADLQYLEEWIPERMDPGTVFLLENQAKLGQAQNPYVAVMSCPKCGTLGLITRRQLYSGEMMICGGEVCSAEYRLDGESICHRPVQKSTTQPKRAGGPGLDFETWIDHAIAPIRPRTTRSPQFRSHRSDHAGSSISLAFLRGFP
jgi:hypothetical protein